MHGLQMLLNKQGASPLLFTATRHAPPASSQRVCRYCAWPPNAARLAGVLPRSFSAVREVAAPRERRQPSSPLFCCSMRQIAARRDFFAALAELSSSSLHGPCCFRQFWFPLMHLSSCMCLESPPVCICPGCATYTCLRPAGLLLNGQVCPFLGQAPHFEHAVGLHVCTRSPAPAMPRAKAPALVFSGPREMHWT